MAIKASQYMFPVFSVWSVTGDMDGSFHKDTRYSSLGCVFPATIANGSVSFYNTDPPSSGHVFTPAISWMMLVTGGTLGLLAFM